MIDALWLVIALPLIGSTINLLFGKRIGQPLAGWIAFGFVALAWLMALPATISLVNGSIPPETNFLFTWIPVVGADVALLWDPLSALMTMIVTGIGSLIHLYSIGYMRGDERYARFFSFLNLFIASMMILVLAANYAMMFIGWELGGLCSYLLISFWFTKPAAAATGKKAFIWDAKRGMRTIEQVLTDKGVDIEGWDLFEAWFITGDGRTIAGDGLNPKGNREAWIAFNP